MKPFLLLLCVLICGTVFAQENEGRVLSSEEEGQVFNLLSVSTIVPSDTAWRAGGLAGLNFSQVSLTNWAGGGQSSVSATASLNVFTNYAKDKVVWENHLDLSYGVISQNNSSLQKSDDRMELNSKLGLAAGDKGLYYTAFLNFKSQFAPGYKYPNDSTKISEFLAPGYLFLGLGFDYKPNDNFTALLAPLTGKLTFVMNQELADAGAFGVKEAIYDDLGVKTADGENLRYEFGGYFKLSYKVDIMENVMFQTKLDLFSNYLHNPLNIDVNWEVLLKMKVNRFINASISTLMIYDDDVDIAVDTDDDGTPDKYGPRLQFKEVFAVGFSYDF